MFWRKRKKAEDALKAAAEIAGDQIAPGAGKWFLIVGGLAVGAAATYVIRKRYKNKKAAPQDGHS
jgi:hypothetical protein